MAQQQDDTDKLTKTTSSAERQGDKDSMDEPDDLGNAVREKTVEGEILTRAETMPEGEKANLEKDQDGNRISMGTDQDQDLDNIKTYLETGMHPPHLTHAAFQRIHQQVLHFFLRGGRLWRRHSQSHHQLVIPLGQWSALIQQAHDSLGHHGFYPTRRTLLDRFWWPTLEADVQQYVRTCHACQLRQTTKARIPPTVDMPAPLFRKMYVDSMLMPPAAGYRYIVQGRCSLTAWPEWRMLRRETGQTLSAFLFEEVLCRWGGIEEIVTDNGSAFVTALDWLQGRYGITHIRISAYNSRANGIVERQHRTIRDSIVKACDGDISRWPTVTPHVFWADRVTTRKSTGHSPFYMTHGIEPILPFDITEVTFLIPDIMEPLCQADLLALCAHQLEKREGNLMEIRSCILRS